MALSTPTLADSFEEESDYRGKPSSGRKFDNSILHKPFINIQITNDPPPVANPTKKAIIRQPQQDISHVMESDQLLFTQVGVSSYSEDRSYSVILNGCNISDDSVHCTLTIGNDGKARDFLLNSTHTAEDNFGNKYLDYSYGRINGKTNFKIYSATSAQGSIEFKTILNAGSFARLKIGVSSNGTEYFNFSNVPLFRR